VFTPERSGGRCLFTMPSAADFIEIAAVIRAR
jgi:hypothetical protein